MVLRHSTDCSVEYFVLLINVATIACEKFITVTFLLANLAFAATRVCVTPSSWHTTEYTAALTPWVDASPKTCSSNERTGC